MIIRESKKEDLNDVINLFKELDEYHRINVPNTYHIISRELREEHFMNCLESDTNYFIVLEVDNKVVGFIDTYLESIENHPVKIDKKFMIVENLIVDEDYRRKGIAQKMYRYVEGIAKELKLDYIKLGVLEFNDAKLFYENIGFVTESRKMIKEL